MSATWRASSKADSVKDCSLASSESSSTCSSRASSHHSIVRSPVLGVKNGEEKGGVEPAQPLSTTSAFPSLISAVSRSSNCGTSSSTSASSSASSSSSSDSSSKDVAVATDSRIPRNGDDWKEAKIEVRKEEKVEMGRRKGILVDSAAPKTGIMKKTTNKNQSDVVSHHPVFVKDTSKYWYKPRISREQAISILRDKPPGTFVIRDSNSFPGAFGLALKVAQPPPGVPPGDGTELVRHFLIEPSPKGVKLKGCNNEPVFGTLSALVYQHSMTPLALPTKLLLPEYDPTTTAESVSAHQALLEQGAACNVAYLGSVDVESLTGVECVRRATGRLLDEISAADSNPPVSVHFKVSSQGITLTDNSRRVFFRRHYPVNSVIFAGIDPSERRWDNTRIFAFQSGYVTAARIFAFVARKFERAENTCHVFAELEPEQPASAVVNFINRVMLAQRRS